MEEYLLVLAASVDGPGGADRSIGGDDMDVAGEVDDGADVGGHEGDAVADFDLVEIVAA